MSNNMEQIDLEAGTASSTKPTSPETAPPVMNEDELKARRNNRIKKGIVALVIVAFVAFVVVDSLTTGYTRDAITAFLEWIEENPIAGFFAFMLVYFFATIFFVPGSLLTLGAGFVFANAFGLGPGILLGSLSVFFGASSGAIVAFLLGRYLLRDWVQGLTQKYAIVEALDGAFQEKGFRIMTLLRLSPIIPFNAINWIAGILNISFKDYCLAMFAILPGTVLYVFLGASAGSLTDSASSGDNSTVTFIVVGAGAVFGIAAIALTSYYAKKELNKVIAAREEDQEGGDEENPDTMMAPAEEQETMAAPVADKMTTADYTSAVVANDDEQDEEIEA